MKPESTEPVKFNLTEMMMRKLWIGGIAISCVVSLIAIIAASAA